MAMIETMRGSVQTWECDMNSHMNVQFYVGHAADSLAFIANALGLSPAYLRDHQQALLAHEHHIRFHREQYAGDPIAMRSGLLAIEGDEIVVYQELRNTLTDAVATTFISRCALIDLPTRKSLALLDEARQRAGALSTDLPAHGAPRGVANAPPKALPSLEQAEKLDMICAYTGVSNTRYVDSYGYLTTPGYITTISDAVPGLVAATPGVARSVDEGIGGAALEYRLIYTATPRQGDLLTLRSGLKAVADKAFSWCHWLFDVNSGRCVARAESVVVCLDLRTRRAVVLPAEIKAALESKMISDLTI